MIVKSNNQVVVQKETNVGEKIRYMQKEMRAQQEKGEALDKRGAKAYAHTILWSDLSLSLSHARAW